jgi:hypothetical protein
MPFATRPITLDDAAVGPGVNLIGQRRFATGLAGAIHREGAQGVNRFTMTNPSRAAMCFADRSHPASTGPDKAPSPKNVCRPA